MRALRFAAVASLLVVNVVGLVRAQSAPGAPAPFLPEDRQVDFGSPVALTQLAGERALELGLPSVAADIFGDLLRQSPQTTEGDRNEWVLQLAAALLDDGRENEAETALQSLSGPPTPQSRVRRAATFARQRRFDAARAELAGLRVEDVPADERGWYHFVQGQLFDANRDFGRASGAFDAAANAAVTELQRARFALAREEVRLLTGEYSESQVSNLRTLMERNPGRNAGYAATSQLAVALNALGRKTEAIDILRRQLQSVPNDQRAVVDEWNLLLGLIAGAGEPVGRNALTRLLSNGVDREKQRVALLLMARGLPKPLFRAELDRQINAATPHPILEDLLLYRANEFVTARLSDDADADAQRLLTTFPGSALRPQALAVRVAAAWERGRYRLAADFATQARGSLPAGRARAELALLVAEAHFRAGDFRSAADAYAAALNELPTGVAAGALIFQQALSEMRAGRLDAAGAILDAAASDPRLDAANRWQAEWNLARELQVAGPEQTRVAYERIERLLAMPVEESANGLNRDLRVRMEWLRARLSLEVGNPERTLTLVEELLASLSEAEAGLRTEVAGSARLLQAEASFALAGRENQGLEILRALRTDFPQSDAAVYSYIVEANRAAAQGRFVDAQGLLVRLADDFRTHSFAPYALYQAALNAERRGQETFYRQANELIERLVRDYPQSELVFYARLKQGDVLRRLNNFGLAQRVYEDLVNNFPQHADVLLAHLALAAAHTAQASSDSTANGQLSGHAETALSIYERLVDRPDASPDLRIEAGYQLGLLLSRRGSGEGRGRAQVVWWQQVITPFLLNDQQAQTLGARGRYWMSRTLLGLGDLLESERKLEQARDAYGLLLAKGLPGEALARAKLARYGVGENKS